MSQTELDHLSREELSALILKQAEMLVALQKEVEALRLKVEKLQKSPPTSKNSAQPPSRDQKPGKRVNRPKRKHGSAQGHVKHARQFVAHPDHLVELKATTCGASHTALHEQLGHLVALNQIVEIPPGQAEVLEVRQYAVTCPTCGQVEVAPVPEGLEMNRCFGTRLETTVTYYRQEQHMSYERTQHTLQALHGVALSQGGIDQIMQRSGQKAQGAASASKPPYNKVK